MAVRRVAGLIRKATVSAAAFLWFGLRFMVCAFAAALVWHATGWSTALGVAVVFLLLAAYDARLAVSVAFVIAMGAALHWLFSGLGSVWFWLASLLIVVAFLYLRAWRAWARRRGGAGRSTS
jgi:hypothetical protein